MVMKRINKFVSKGKPKENALANSLRLKNLTDDGMFIIKLLQVKHDDGHWHNVQIYNDH